MTHGRIPRAARLLALAHRFERLIAEGIIANYAELARLGQVSRARISQIMSLLYLAPDIQEVILFRSRRGRDDVSVAELLAIAAPWDWQEQRRLWKEQYVALISRPGRAAKDQRISNFQNLTRMLISRRDL